MRSAHGCDIIIVMQKHRFSIQLVLSPFISQLGSAIYLLGLNWLVVKQTGDTKLIGLITGVGGTMFFLGDFLAAVIVDHHDRKRVMLVCNAIAAAICVFGAWLIDPNAPQTWLLILITSVLDLMTTINFPAAKAITPDIIAAPALQRFNAIANAVFSMASILSPLIGGLLLSSGRLGFQGFLLINAGSYVVASLLVWTLNSPVFEPGEDASDPIKDTIYGLKYVVGNHQLALMMLALGAFNFCAAGFLLAAPYMADHLYAGRPSAYSTFLLINACGGLLGGAVLSLQRQRVSVMQVYTEQLVIGVLMVGLGFHLTHFLWLALALINGFVNSQMFSSVATLMQGMTPRELLGRVFGLIFLVYDGVQPLGNFFFGQFIKIWGARTYTVLGAILVLSFALLIWATRRTQAKAAV